MVVLAIQKFQDPYYQGFAAQMAFFYMLSIVPLITVLSQILNVFDISMRFMEDLLTKYGNGIIGSTISEWFEGSNAVTTNIILIILALWAGSRAQFALARITNYTMTSGKSTGKGYFQERFRSVMTIAITIIALVFSLIVLVFGEKIMYVVLSGIELYLGIDYQVDSIWMILRWLIAFLLYLGVIILNYYILPTKRPRIRSIVPGGLFASGGMLVVTLIYSKYTEFALSAGNYNIMYGSLASIVALMFWFYFISWVLGLGAVFNSVWQETGQTEE